MDKKIIKNKNILFVCIGLIIIIMFFYFNYKIEVSGTFLYKDAQTGEILKDLKANIIFYIVFMILSAYTMLVGTWLVEKIDKIKIENIFLCIVPIFCVFTMLAMPMSKGHDETIHALRIYEYAEGKIISNGEKAYLEEGVIKALDNKDTYKDVLNKNNNYSTNTETIEWGYRIATYSPVNYLPQVIGISISRLFTTNSMIHLYIGRLCNIISCVIMLYFAIKIIPFGKNLLFLFSIIPISIEGFSTLSADGMLLTSSFLWISYILYLCFEKDKIIEKKDIFILSIIAIIIALSKTIYIVLLPLLLLIPKEKWGNRNKKILIVGLICVISAILDIIWYFVGIQKETLITGNNAFSYILQNPIMYTQKIVYTIIVNFEKYIKEIFGATMEWNEQVKVHLFPYILLVMSVMITIKGQEKIDLKIWQKIVISVVILACVFLVFTSMFLAWSKVDVAYIQGVQGRYFMPIIPLIFLLFGRKFSDSKDLTKLITIVGLIMQIYVIVELVLYHI